MPPETMIAIEAKGHGGPDMPVWGDVFARSGDVSDPAIVQARIKALVAYLEGIQVKTADY